MRRAIKALTLMAIGGTLYFLIEVLYRGWSHPAMLLVGGVCFLIVGALNEVLPWETPLIAQGFAGACLVTAVELVSGLVLNVALGLHIWDYSARWGNLAGQICPLFFLLWIPLCMAAVVIDDWLRHWLFGEERPHYKMWRWGG